MPFLVSAAGISASMSTETKGSGVYVIEVLLNSDKESINAIEGEIKIPLQSINIEKISTGKSIVTVWLQEPSLNDSPIRFSGVIAKGFNGDRGVLFKIYATAKTSGEASILASGKAYLNDGNGTVREIAKKEESYSLAKFEKQEALAQAITVDETPPRILQSAISENEAMFDGKPFIIVHAKDDESGVSKYELGLSDTRKDPKEVANDSSIQWQVFASPALLPDNFFEKYVYIKVEDKDGNIIAQLVSSPKQLSPENQISWLKKWWGFCILIVIVFGLILIVRWLLRRHGSTPSSSI
jgi:hypothetical protein